MFVAYALIIISAHSLSLKSFYLCGAGNEGILLSRCSTSKLKVADVDLWLELPRHHRFLLLASR